MTPGTVHMAVAELGRSLFVRRLTFGRTGNISTRVGDHIMITPSGSSLGDLFDTEMSLVSLDGTHVDGPKPSKEVFLHLAMYRSRPRDRAIVHTHSTFSAAVSCLKVADTSSVLPPLTAYFAMRVGTLPLLPYRAPGDQSLGFLAEASAKRHHALLLANHGPIASAGSLLGAADIIEEIEETAKIFIALRGFITTPLTIQQVRALGQPVDQ